IGVDMGAVRQSVEDAVKGSSVSRSPIRNMPITKQAEKVLKITYLEAKIFKSDIIGTEHLLLAILRDEENIASQILQQFNVSYNLFNTEVEQNATRITAEASSTPPGGDEEDADDDPQLSPPKKVSDIKSKCPVLDTFGRDL